MMNVIFHQNIDLPSRKHLVFTSAGDNANLHFWLKGRRNFDLLICYYGDTDGRYREFSDFYIARKGGKFPNLHFVYQHWKNILDHYHDVLVMDDDIIINGSDISCLFDIRQHYGLSLLQPAFDPHGKISHAVTRYKPFSFMRYVDFVEVTCPLFNKNTLDNFMKIYDPVLVGWGVDLWFMDSLLPDINGKVAIIDAVTCINPHDDTKGGRREIDDLQDTNTRIENWKKIKFKYNIQYDTPRKCVEFSSVKTSFNYFPRLTFKAILVSFKYLPYLIFKKFLDSVIYFSRKIMRSGDSLVNKMERIENAVTPSAFPPIWVINLPRSVERREYICGHLQALGLRFENISAVDGNALPAQELAEIYSAKAALACIGRELAPGEIGCALSHLRLYRRMVDEDIDMALILEDDAVIHPDTLDILARRMDFPSDWELLLLHHLPDIGGPISWWHRQSLTPAYRIGRFALPAYGTAGYLIKQSAARKFLAQAYPIRAPADHWTGGNIWTGVRLYGLEPPCIRQRHEGNPTDTTMPERDVLQSQMEQPLQPLKGILGRFLYQLQIWIIKWRLYRLKVWLAKFHTGKII